MGPPCAEKRKTQCSAHEPSSFTSGDPRRLCLEAAASHGLVYRAFLRHARLAAQARQQESASARPKRQSDPRIEQRMNADLVALLKQDLTNVEAGIYPLHADHDGSLLTLLDRSLLFFRDLPDVDARRKRNATHEVLNSKTRRRRPDYYLQNFHFQSGGW